MAARSLPLVFFPRLAPLIRHDAIAVFARLPESGKVKTRLTGQLSADEAAEVHLACVHDTIALVNSLPQGTKFLMLAGDPAASLRFAQGLGLSPRWKIALQQGRNLGARLDRAVRQLRRSGAKRVVVVGTDTPWMGERRIKQAFAALQKVDVVIGPTVDGGYYLIGTRKRVPQMFAGISWGTGRVLSQSLLALGKARLSYHLLFRDFDLDRPDDLARVRELFQRGWCKSPELEKWLRR